MTLLQVGLRNARRAPLRAVATVLAVAISLLGFILLRAISAAWTERVRQTPDNRVITRDELGWSEKLPAYYADSIRELPGIRNAVAAVAVSMALPADDRIRFQAMAVEAEPFVAIHDELEGPSEQKRAFIEDRQGALVSEPLAKELGWHRGDKLHLRERTSAREWELTLSGTYVSRRHGFAERSIWFHLENFNEAVDADERDKISFVSAQVTDPSSTAAIAKSVDIYFGDKPHQTFSQDDQASNASFIGRFAAILDAINLVSVLVLAVVLLILGNTLAVSARERTREYAVLRAIGFSPRQIVALVLSEAASLGVAGGLLSVLVAGPIAEHWVSRYLERTAEFVPLRLSLSVASGAVVLGALLALLAAALPTRYALRLDVVDCLRRVN